MFTVYHANQIEDQKDLLVKILEQDPNPNPFAQEIIIVQSLGMAQWLQMRIADSLGVTGSIQFPYPTSFLWQQYRTLFPELPKENIFERSTLVWRLMRLIPSFLEQEEFQALRAYLASSDSTRLFQLASKIADLFDQYLVYRPQWLVDWEQGREQNVFDEITQSLSFKRKNIEEIRLSIQWQSILWNAVVQDVKQDTDEVIFNTSHRAYLQQRYFAKLDNLTVDEKAKLPPRIFVFGLSSLPKTQLAVLAKLSEHCHVHLFFTNPSEVFWGDNQEERILEKIALRQQLSPEELADLREQQVNPLLSMWGKQGREFLNLLTELSPQAVDFYQNFAQSSPTLLTQVKQAILYAEPNSDFVLNDGDMSIQLHSCHSKMREIEVLHNRLLQLFEQYPTLSPKDIIVMSADIDNYAPYINAVFSRYSREDPRFIPFTLSDQKMSYINPILASFLQLLSLKESQFTVEQVIDLFDVEAIKQRYALTEANVATLRQWIEQAGIRAGIEIDNHYWKNYNSWQNGLNRLLLGTCLTESYHTWQEIVAFNESYGLTAELVGQLAKFIENLTAWSEFIAEPHSIEQWQLMLRKLIEDFYAEDEHSSEVLGLLYNALEQLVTHITHARFEQVIEVDIIQQLFENLLSEQRSNLNFLVGKVNFCTLLPMRAIPFKVVCLLGMNEGEFPRQQMINSFDLMQYAQQKGDRARRDDDRYLFLEALLSAQQIFYISYIGQSLTNNQSKLPSILVSQLWDYLKKNVAESTLLDSNLIHHSMSVFGTKNFTGGNVSYDKEWLEVKNSSVEIQPFLTEIHQAEANLPTQIALNDLIAYIQDPLKFFFEQRLGVKLPNEENQLIESEHFQLSGLDKYQLFEQLVEIEDEQIADFFRQSQLKGGLPAQNFAELAKSQLSQEIEALKWTLRDYLKQPQSQLEIDYSLQVDGRNLQLIGEIPRQFGQQIVQWRVGDLRDKDIIQSWIYFLVLQLQQPAMTEFRFYYRSKNSVGYLSFKSVDPSTAKQILQHYVQDYLASFTQLRWALTENVTKYVGQKEPKGKKAQQETLPADLCREYVEKCKNVYVQRILSQTNSIDFDIIHQRTLAWFGLMVESIQQSSEEQ